MGHGDIATANRTSEAITDRDQLRQELYSSCCSMLHVPNHCVGSLQARMNHFLEHRRQMLMLPRNAKWNRASNLV